MRILYIIGQLSRGGAEQQFYYLLKYLRPDACVISLRQDGYWTEPIRALGIEVIELKRRGRGDLARLAEIVRIIRRYQPDIIHIFIDNLYGLYGRLAALLTGHPRVIVGERAHPTYDPRWYIDLRHFWLNRSVRYIVANSKTALDYLTREMGLPPRKAVFIPNGIEIERIHQEASTTPSTLPESWQNAVIIGTVANVAPRKNPELFLQVAQRVITKHPDVRFLWVGDGELLNQMQAQCVSMELEQFVMFVGRQLNVAQWLRALSIFILTSNFEGTPNAAMEAMVVSLPCIVTNVGGSSELVQNGITGFVVPSGDAETLGDRICRLIEDAELRHRMGAAGHATIQDYDVHTMAKAYQKLYTACLLSN